MHWTRRHVQSIDAAMAFARLVLPTPGISDEEVTLGQQAGEGQLDRLRLALDGPADVAGDHVEQVEEGGRSALDDRHGREG